MLTGILYMYMKLVVLDGYTENPGDLDWRGMEALGDLTVYARTDHSQVKERMQDADAVIINKVPMTRELMQESSSFVTSVYWQPAMMLSISKPQEISISQLPMFPGMVRIRLHSMPLHFYWR